MKNTRVLIADDHSVVRKGIRTLLDSIEGITVVAEASDGKEALENVSEHAPDILLVDISMRGMNGLQVLREIRP